MKDLKKETGTEDIKDTGQEQQMLETTSVEQEENSFKCGTLDLKKETGS